MSEVGACAVLLADIEHLRFVRGVEAGRWKLHSLKGTTALVDVRARSLPDETDWFRFRFVLDSYPHVAPAACLWSRSVDEPLPADQWPTGTDAGRVFNPNWNSQAIYLPLDRVAQAGHDSWKAQCPRLWWTSDHTITDYVLELWRLLNSQGYEGLRHAS